MQILILTDKSLLVIIISIYSTQISGQIKRVFTCSVQIYTSAAVEVQALDAGNGFIKP